LVLERGGRRDAKPRTIADGDTLLQELEALGDGGPRVSGRFEDVSDDVTKWLL
jgi:hypothetical protein